MPAIARKKCINTQNSCNPLTIKGLRRPRRRKSLIINDLRNTINVDFPPFFPYLIYMITIIRNANFPNWVNINVDGKMVDNAPNYAKAMQIAQRLQKNNKLPIIKK